MQKLIFITGPGRCGTHLILSLLDGNKKLNVVPGEITNIFIDNLFRNGQSNRVYKFNKNIIFENFKAALKDHNFPFVNKKLSKIKKLINFKFRKNLLKPVANLKLKEFYNAPRQILPKTFWQVGNFDFLRINYKNNLKSVSGKKIVENENPNFKEIPLEMTESDDKRSYHINSDKINQVLGFKAKRSIEDGIKDLCLCFKKKMFVDSLNNEIYFNVKRLNKIKAS